MFRSYIIALCLDFCLTDHRHTVCINNNLIYLFGGADLEQRTNELYSFDPCKSNEVKSSNIETIYSIHILNYTFMATFHTHFFNCTIALILTSAGHFQKKLKKIYYQVAVHRKVVHFVDYHAQETFLFYKNFYSLNISKEKASLLLILHLFNNSPFLMLCPFFFFT